MVTVVSSHTALLAFLGTRVITDGGGVGLSFVSGRQSF